MSDCRNEVVQLGCFTPTSGDPVTVKYVTVFNDKGVNIAEYYADAEGNTIDPATYLGGGFATLGPCSNECDLTKIWSIKGDNGVALQQWTASAIDTGAELPTTSIFVNEDAEGYPAHQNAPDISVTQGTFVQPNIVGVDQHQIDAWIYVPTLARLQDSAGLVETGEIWTGVCGGALSLAESWLATTPYSAREFATLSPGFHRIRVYINDYSPDSSGFNLQWDVDGAWSDVPAEYLFLEEPTIECRTVRICGDQYVDLDGTEITLGEFDYTCEPALCGATTTAAVSETCWKYRQDVLAIDNAGTSFGGNIQSVTRLIGESNGESFDLTFPIGAYEFSGTGGNNQTASIANAINAALDDSEIPHNRFYNDVLTVSGVYLAWTTVVQACPDFNITTAEITRENGTTVRKLPIYREEGDLQFVTRRACAGCNGGYEWVDPVGNKVPQPETGCLKPCGEDYPEVDPPAEPTCVPLEPTVVCYDTDGNGEADLSTYNVATACNGIIDEVATYDLATVSANPSDPDLWAEITVPAGAVAITCAGAELIDSKNLCDSEGTLHDVRTYSFGGVEYQETYEPGTDIQSTVVGSLGGCGALSPITVKTCTLDNTVKRQVWNPNFIDLETSQFATDAFTYVDEYGLPKHVNAPDSVVYDGAPRVINATGGANANTVTENQQLDFYVLPDFGSTALIRAAGSAAESGTVYVGDSPVNAVKVIEWAEVAMNPSPVIAEVTNSCCSGKFIRVYMADTGPNSADITMQWSLDNGETWATIPAEFISSAKPTCSSEIRWVSEGGSLALGTHEALGECGCAESATPAPSHCEFRTLHTLGANTEIGINLEYWGANAAPHGDPEGIWSDWNTHINGAPDGVGTTDIDWAFTDVNVASYVGVTNTGTDQFLAYAWIDIKEGQYLRDINANSGEALAFYSSKCTFAPELKLKSTPPEVNLGDLGYFEPGLYFVAFQVSDTSASSGIQLQSSADGTTWGNFPIEDTYLRKPTWSCRSVKQCDDGTAYELDGSTLVLTDYDYWCKPDECVPESTSSGSTEVVTPTAEEIAAANIAAERNVTPRMYSWLNETNMVSLVDSAGDPYPAGTMGEIISVEDTGGGLVRMSINGSDPVSAVGDTFLITGPYHSGFNLKNVDLSLVRLNGSSTASDFSIMYHEYN